MDRAALRAQLIDVVQTAHEALRDDANAARLWGSTTDLCDVLEQHNHGDTERVMIAALREDIRAGARSLEELVDEIMWFARAIERDLRDEEQDEIVDGVVCCDQTDG